ncbi:MAG: MarR family transcriptional regulator [Methylophilaceae bacterium 17-44-8]|jgi:DNA-binding MarR family transcriptional regulator|nr:MAG: MarR family transcriptional regulator [Methylophilaceae bacterium 17-44-8]
MKHENLKLDNQLCFALYSATHALTRAYRNVLDAKGLTYTQYLVLLVLWENDCMSVSAIAQKLDLDSASLTPILKRLETAGILQRLRNKSDERVVEIKLTEKGNLLQDEIAGIQKGVACKTGLATQEFNQLKKTLHELVRVMNTETEAQPAEAI